MSDHISHALDAARMSVPMRNALRMILVDKQTWRVASGCTGVSESGIHRAIKRLRKQQHQCPLCGQPIPTGTQAG